MNDNQKIVMDLLGQTLFGVPFEQTKYSNINWEEVLAEASKQVVIPTTVEAVPVEASKDVRMQWIRWACENEARCYRVLCGHSMIDRIMNKAGIPYVILKGAASGAYYPAMHQRAYGDVDFLIPEDSRNAVLNILNNEGFETGAIKPYEIDLTRDQIDFDMHISVNGIPEGTCGDAAKNILKDIINASQDLEINCDRVKVPDELRHGMVLLLHTAVHMVGFGVGLRQLCDWAVFANYMGERFHAMFEEPLKQTGLWRFAQIMSAACVIYLHMPEYSWCRIKKKERPLVDRFVEEVLRKGNLAHTGEDDLDAVFMKEGDKGGIGRTGVLLQALKNIASKVKYQWPVMNKYKVMIPFGMIFMFMRYFRGIADGSYKKISFKETIGRAKQRKEFYEELDLFQEER